MPHNKTTPPYLKFLNLVLLPESDKAGVHKCYKTPGTTMGRDITDSIETRYQLDSPGTKPRWGAIFSAPVPTGPAAHPAFYTIRNSLFPRVRRRCAEVKRKKNRAISLLPLWIVTECCRLNFTFSRNLPNTLGARKVTWSLFHTPDPQTLSAWEQYPLTR
jgi:hypothetical protein